ncbi:MAG TPA: YbfB/YjiJ family MFS transporter, partial [Dehalococcoidia bacterium]|nr:YbfB/YjiJ family MFS transporter [Dehalococcoidia bacterium]
MSFVNAHFVTYARDLGYHPMVAAGIFSVIGACAIVGALYFGNLSDKMGRRPVLTFAYQLRALGFIVVLLSMGVSFLGIPALGIGPLVIGVILVGFS